MRDRLVATVERIPPLVQMADSVVVHARKTA
jgi:hypothetical protein